MPEQNVIHLDKNDKKPSLKEKITLKIASIKDRVKGVRGSASGAVGGVFSVIFSRIALIFATLKTLFQNKVILYATIIGVVLLVILIVLLVLVLNKKEPLSVIYTPKPQTTQNKSTDSTKITSKNANEVQNLITKAALLYNSGHTLEALNIYNNAAIFSQSFANFNLGVAKLKENNYKDALKAFDETIKSGENISAAAINAATIAYKNNNLSAYNYYVNLAKGTLIEWANKPLYSYLYSLINFYDANYFNTLSSLNNPTSPFYSDESALLSAKIYLNFNDDYNALKKLLEVNSIDNRFNIGLIYARMGEYDLSADYISNYIRDDNSPQANMALALVELKRSNFTQSADIYNNLMKQYELKDLSDIYPIKIKLKDALFDINLAQKTFWMQNASSQMAMLWHYKILFYFAPFRVFDINNAIALINDGGLKLRMNNLQEASSHLTSGAMLSNINQQITQGLKEILKYNINEALKIMQDSAKQYPNHQVLQYNLGLIYAQLNDFQNARKHFLKAYHLDSSDVLSGIFALMTSQLTQQDTARIINDISANFEEVQFENGLQEAFYRSLFGYANGNITDDMLWFNEIKDSATLELKTPRISAQNAKSTPLMFALNAMYSLGTRDKNIIANAFKELQTKSNNDIVAMILARISSHYNENIKAFSLNLFDFFKNDLRQLDAVITGPNLARQIYIYMAFLVGANSYVDDMLNKELLSKEGEVSGILQALALNAIYMLDFERAFTYYNELIDVYKMQTSEIYFYAAVAAIGAGYYDNAVALIQLSRMDNASNFEARYALGLLHQAMGNLNLASMQFGSISQNGFKSDFFDFEIDTSGIIKSQKMGKK